MAGSLANGVGMDVFHMHSSGIFCSDEKIMRNRRRGTSPVPFKRVIRLRRCLPRPGLGIWLGSVETCRFAVNGERLTNGERHD
jgi:hypothetical protein